MPVADASSKIDVTSRQNAGGPGRQRTPLGQAYSFFALNATVPMTFVTTALSVSSTRSTELGVPTVGRKPNHVGCGREDTAEFEARNLS